MGGTSAQSAIAVQLSMTDHNLTTMLVAHLIGLASITAQILAGIVIQ
jgi:hypothetical protein